VNLGVIAPASASNFTYRVTWWLPTAVVCRVLGVTEAGLVLPVTAAAVAGIGVVYALGKALFRRAGAVVAAALLIVLPLDVAWSTMLANDVFCSLFLAATMLAVVRAVDHPVPATRRRLGWTAGLCLALAYHAKVTAVALAPAVAWALWRRVPLRDPATRGVAGGIALGFGLSLLVCWALAGDPLSPFRSEIVAQGLVGEKALQYHRLDRQLFWTYPRLLFLPNHLGDLTFSVLPHLAVAGLVVGPLLGLRPNGVVLVWLLALFLTMQLNLQRVDGVWVAGFRNVRHAHVLVHPLVLLLAGWAVALRARAPRATAALVVALVVAGAAQSAAVASKTRAAFADQRAAGTLLRGLPRKPIHSDFQMKSWMMSAFPQPIPFVIDVGGDPDTRRKRFAEALSGYAVTGGGREPYYGCTHCIPRADELDPAQWRLVREFADGAAPTPWRPEPVRVWERIPAEDVSPGTAGTR
jgi:4-amino-4-deoxy-L-arabinose transferase-like glycosyltransferase